ncbi:PREDICTED: 39S ribosomal protein L22, mitochondrial isoform X5 [Miniopterus natalensis]|uniref:39S ribosomal protein L22, mitochondrial isoform X5 n=1 Tax=Miniopterus natalensis TaxID=291302 RepID=UPI0007A6BBD5|nr:PREDICTED: 39S ribosomal protein L22, mitochondrial isoform X5 [Miniopterus natalensis]
MAAAILDRLGALWMQNQTGKLALGPDVVLGARTQRMLDLFSEISDLYPYYRNSYSKCLLFYRLLSSCSILPQSHIHASASLDISRKWEKKNKIVYPPQLPGEPRRPAEIYHCRRQIKYSKDKMWYLAKLIRGMSIDQALAQLEFSDKKGAQIIKEILLEAQDMAVRDHNVEFRSNLYIAESTSGRGQYLKRIRYHGRGRFGIMEKVYCHYFVKLVEGPPPPLEAPKTAVAHAKEYIQELQNRTIIHTL